MFCHRWQLLFTCIFIIFWVIFIMHKLNLAVWVRTLSVILFFAIYNKHLQLPIPSWWSPREKSAPEVSSRAPSNLQSVDTDPEPRKTSSTYARPDIWIQLDFPCCRQPSPPNLHIVQFDLNWWKNTDCSESFVPTYKKFQHSAQFKQCLFYLYMGAQQTGRDIINLLNKIIVQHS